MSIQILPDHVISQIAAGEVVERPASVVKELLENALDAGATSLHIEYTAGGRRLIRISDNGSGIASDEVRLAFERHATSKLRDADDLYRIQTLGFRGEALASIASVSQTTLSTRHRDDDVGTEIRVEGGYIISEKPAGVPAGTVITVENLFYNVPARLKFLKSENTEKRHIQTIVTRCAMAFPAVRFVLVQDGREVFRSTGSGQLSDVIVKVLGLDIFKDMVEINGDAKLPQTEDRLRLHGFVSSPSLNRKDRTRIMLFVNGRVIQDSNLTYAVVQAYHTLMDKTRYPLAVLMLQIPPDFVDVNVHPAKAEVRFRDPGAVFVAVQRTVRQAVVGLVEREHVGLSQIEPEQESRWQLPVRRSQMDLDLDLDEDDNAGHFPELAVTERDAADAAIPEGPGRPRKPRTLPPLRVVGQIGAAYIVAEGPAGMYLIDQRAAHQRVLYEQIRAILDGETSPVSQTLATGQAVDLSAKEAALLADHLDLLKAVGFDVELFGTNTFMIRAVPDVLVRRDAVETVAFMVTALYPDAEPADATLEERLAMRISQRAAVRVGQIMGQPEMQALISKLERCQSPHTAPDGHPTLLHMSADQLAREFGRS